MPVDGHVIDSLRRYFDDSYQELKKEWISGEHERLSDCPSFKTANTYLEAMNVLIKGSGDNEIQLKRLIGEELEVENFWKNK